MFKLILFTLLISNSGLSGSLDQPRMHQTKASTSQRRRSCEGEVASVQVEYRICDFFDTDDGRGVLSARELSKNLVERYMITQTILFHLSFNANRKLLRSVRVLMWQPFHRPDLDTYYRSFISAAVPLPFTAAGV